MHAFWCGEQCSECVYPCIYDEGMPCSPDCEALLPDGTRDISQCIASGCDAYEDMLQGEL